MRESSIEAVEDDLHGRSIRRHGQQLQVARCRVRARLAMAWCQDALLGSRSTCAPFGSLSMLKRDLGRWAGLRPAGSSVPDGRLTTGRQLQHGPP